MKNILVLSLLLCALILPCETMHASDPRRGSQDTHRKNKAHRLRDKRKKAAARASLLAQQTEEKLPPVLDDPDDFLPLGALQEPQQQQQSPVALPSPAGRKRVNIGVLATLLKQQEEHNKPTRIVHPEVPTVQQTSLHANNSKFPRQPVGWPGDRTAIRCVCKNPHPGESCW